MGFFLWFSGIHEWVFFFWFLGVEVSKNTSANEWLTKAMGGRGVLTFQFDQWIIKRSLKLHENNKIPNRKQSKCLYRQRQESIRCWSQF